MPCPASMKDLLGIVIVMGIDKIVDILFDCRPTTLVLYLDVETLNRFMVKMRAGSKPRATVIAFYDYPRHRPGPYPITPTGGIFSSGFLPIHGGTPQASKLGVCIHGIIPP